MILMRIWREVKTQSTRAIDFSSPLGIFDSGVSLRMLPPKGQDILRVRSLSTAESREVGGSQSFAVGISDTYVRRTAHCKAPVFGTQARGWGAYNPIRERANTNGRLPWSLCANAGQRAELSKHAISSALPSE